MVIIKWLDGKIRRQYRRQKGLHLLLSGGTHWYVAGVIVEHKRADDC
jgi:hypothetical protein